MKEALVNWIMAQCMRYAQNGCCDTEFYYDGNTLGDYVDVNIHFKMSDIAQAADDCSWYILDDFDYETYDEFVEKEEEGVIETVWRAFIPQFENWAEDAIREWAMNLAIELEDWETLAMIDDDDYDDDDEEDEDHPDYEEWFRETYCSQ